MNRFSKLLAGAAVGMAASLLAAQAQAAVFIAFQTGVSPVNVFSAGDGPFNFAANCSLVNCGGFSTVSVGGTTGTMPSLLHSDTVDAKRSGVANLTIWVTRTNITGGLPTGGFTTSFTSNNTQRTNGTTPFSVKLTSLASASNALYGGTQLSTFSSAAVGATSSNQFAGPIGFNPGLYSVTEKYELHATAGGNGLSTSPSIILSAVAVPEPATWALMILGFGSAGAMVRRRRAAMAAA